MKGGYILNWGSGRGEVTQHRVGSAPAPLISIKDTSSPHAHLHKSEPRKRSLQVFWTDESLAIGGSEVKWLDGIGYVPAINPLTPGCFYYTTEVYMGDVDVDVVDPKDPLDIVFFSGGIPHDGQTLSQRSLGGSETAALMISKALAKRGHYVTVFSPNQGGCWDGVVFAPIEQFHSYAMSTPHDVTVVSRMPEILRARFQSKISILWCHDLSIKRSRGNLGSALWNLDAIYLLSRFQIDQYKEVNPQIPDTLYWQTRNGIDLAKFQGLEKIPRDKNKVVYGSRPERGLETCLNIMEELWRQKSPLKLYVSSYDGTPEQLKDYYNYLYSRAQQMPNVVLLGPLKQADWHKQLASARMMIYPGVSSEFNEISPVHGDTIIETMEYGRVPIKSLEGKVGFRVYSRNEAGKLSSSKVNGVFLTRKAAKVIKLSFAPGRRLKGKITKTLTCTPDHEIMLLDGRYKAAGDLKSGDRVIGFHRYEKNIRGINYYTIGLTGNGEQAEHRFVMGEAVGRRLQRDEYVHHRDENGLNNQLNNLVIMSPEDHSKHHNLLDPSDPRSNIRSMEKSIRRRRELSTDDGLVKWRAIIAQSAAVRRARGRKRHDYECDVCGKAFTRRDRVLTATKFCSVECNLMRARDIRWDRDKPSRKVLSNHIVVKVEDANEADVYCMEVEPDHNFIANGIVVHNCIAAMEAQACGTPMVTLAKGALLETCPTQAATLVGHQNQDVNDPAYIKEFARHMMQLHEHDALFRSMSFAGREASTMRDWNDIAAEWEADWHRRLALQVNDVFRMKQHLTREGDWDALHELE